MRWLWHRTCVPKFRLKPTVRKAELDARLAEEAQKAEARLQAARDAALGGLEAAARDVVGDVMQAVGLGAPDASDIDAALKAAQKG